VNPYCFKRIAKDSILQDARFGEEVLSSLTPFPFLESKTLNVLPGLVAASFPVSDGEFTARRQRLWKLADTGQWCLSLLW
jgi:hypothetical protein